MPPLLKAALAHVQFVADDRERIATLGRAAVSALTMARGSGHFKAAQYTVP